MMRINFYLIKDLQMKLLKEIAKEIVNNTILIKNNRTVNLTDKQFKVMFIMMKEDWYINPIIDMCYELSYKCLYMQHIKTITQTDCEYNAILNKRFYEYWTHRKYKHLQTYYMWGVSELVYLLYTTWWLKSILHKYQHEIEQYISDLLSDLWVKQKLPPTSWQNLEMQDEI